MSRSLQIRRYLPAMLAVTAMALLALAVGAYVLAHQRVRFPWQQRYTVRIELTSAQAITPGQGQTIDVAGVAVGSITDVRLDNGVAVVTGEIDPHKLPHVYANATALVRPKTGLQDMVVAIDPGGKPAKALPDGGTIPVSQTRPQVNLDELLAGLDQDSRDYLRTLLSGAARGLQGRGAQLRALFKAGVPTLRLTRRVTQKIADRRAKVARLVRNLRLLSEATAGRDQQLAQLISSSARAFGAIDAEQAALRAGIGKLPGTIDSAQRALAAAKPFSEELGPTLDSLLPATRKLPGALRAAHPLVRSGTGRLRTLRGLVATARPVLADLRPATADLAASTPDLTRSFAVLQRVVNELAYNPPGKDEGYLFWLAWFAHNGGSLLSGRDAHGTFWRGQTIFSCSTLSALGRVQRAADALEPLLELAPCPAPPAGGGSVNGGGG